MPIHSGDIKILFTCLAIVSMVAVSPCIAQEIDMPLSKPEHREILNEYDRRAKDFVAKNLNRFALDRLRSYDYFLDSLYKYEMKDTLEVLEKNYQVRSSNQKNTIQQQRSRISELTTQESEFEDRYWSLVRKSLLSFAVWLIVVFLVLQFRKRRLRKSEQRLTKATEQLGILESNEVKAASLFESMRKRLEPMVKLEEDAEQVRTLVTQNGLETSPDGWKEFSLRSEKLSNAINLEKRIVESVLAQEIESEDTKTETNINKLCEQYLEVACRGLLKDDPYNIQVTTDFEKRLPAIQVNQPAVGTLLLNVLMNAFDSVKLKSAQEIKGYQPAIGISTRILPRFLQIRVKDNGVGMGDAALQKAIEEFYSTKEMPQGAGLGLFVANNIITTLHKGEIKIESEEGNSSDVYIKFFI